MRYSILLSRPCRRMPNHPVVHDLLLDGGRGVGFQATRVPRGGAWTGGFVDCCDKNQVSLVRESYFPTGSTVVALTIDPTTLDSVTRYQPGSGGELERFPHVYGSIRRTDVVEVTVL